MFAEVPSGIIIYKMKDFIKYLKLFFYFFIVSCIILSSVRINAKQFDQQNFNKINLLHNENSQSIKDCKFKNSEDIMLCLYIKQKKENVNVKIISSALSEHYTFLDLDRSLVGWWRMDDVSGATVMDLSSWRNDGKLYSEGANPELPYLEEGKYGKSFRFNPLDRYTVNGIKLSFEPSSLDVGRAFSISAWVKLEPIEDGDSDYIYPILTSRGEAPILYYFSIEPYNFPFNLALRFGNEKNIKLAKINVSALLPNEWYHVAVTIDKNSEKNASFYVDGNLIGIVEGKPKSFYGSDSASIGGDLANSFTFGGNIDELLLFNRTLVADEIASLYNAKENKYSYNFFGLSPGKHSFQGHAVDLNGSKASTEVKSLVFKYKN